MLALNTLTAATPVCVWGGGLSASLSFLYSQGQEVGNKRPTLCTVSNPPPRGELQDPWQRP